jgi:hypothetical protein
MSHYSKRKRSGKKGHQGLVSGSPKPAVEGTTDEGSEAVQLGLEYLARLQARASHSLILDPVRAEAVLSLSQKMMEYENVPLETRETWAEAFEYSVHRMSTSVADRPDQDVATLEIVTGLLNRVESAASTLEVKTLDHSVIGTLGEESLSAFSFSFFRATALIGVPAHLMVFVHLLAKAICECISVKTNDGGIRIGVQPPAKQLTNGTHRLAELIRAIRDHRNPMAAPINVPPPGWFLWRPVHSIVECIELFIIAHEYAHLLMNHGEVMFTPQQGDATSGQDEEHSADVFAQIILLADAARSDLYFAVLSPLLLFKSLALMERHSILPPPRDHPSSDERLQTLLQSLEALATFPSERKPIKDMLGVWSNVERLLDEAWSWAIQSLSADSNQVESDH